MQQQRPATRRRELVRTPDRGWIAGVSNGIAEHFDIEPWIPRASFFVLTFAGGLGTLLYILAWVLIRREDEPNSIGDRTFGDMRGARSWIGFGLVVGAAMLFLGATEIVDGELVLAAGLLVAGLLLWRGRPTDGSHAPLVPPIMSDRPERTPVEPAPYRAPEPDRSEATATVAARGGQVDDPILSSARAEVDEVAPWTGLEPLADGDGGQYVDGDASADVDEPRKRRGRKRSYLGRLTVGVGLLVIGIMAALDAVDIANPLPRHYAGGLMLIVGGGLLVGTFSGRARWLIGIGILLTPVLVASSFLPASLDGRWGESLFRPTTAENLQSEYSMAAGSLELDLRGFAGLDADRTIDVDLGFGEVVLSVPDGLNVIVNADVGAGEIQLHNAREVSVDRNGNVFVERFALTDRSGVGIDDRIELLDGTGPTLTINADVGFGLVEVVTHR